MLRPEGRLHQSPVGICLAGWLVVVVLAAVGAGCGTQGQALAPLDTSSDTQESSQTILLDSRAGPSCAQIGQPKSSIHQEMYEALNSYRIENGLQPLYYSQTLEEAADNQAEDLWVRSFFSHTNPSGEGPGARALSAGFCHQYVGENIAAGYTTVQQVMEAWKTSPGHNANMLDPDFVYVGMGYSFDARGRMYWAQEFAFSLP